MERPRDKWVCHFDLLKKKGCHYEGQYDAENDKFINIRQNEDNIQECDFSKVAKWSYVDIEFTKQLIKEHPRSATTEFVNQMKVWGVW